MFDVLGIMGPSRSGKDLVGDWFVSKGFAKVSYADPMKRFAKSLFGFTDLQLWGPSTERNTNLDTSDEWWLAAAGNLNNAAQEILQHILPEGQKATGYLSLMDWFSGLRKTYGERISPRVVLQTLGTEWGRAVDPLLWVNYTHENIIERLKTKGRGYSHAHGVVWRGEDTPSYAGVIIPDHRFLNELKTTQFHNGHVIKLKRLSLSGEEVVGIKGHQSESEQLSIPDTAYDLILEFPEGVDKVYAILDTVYKERSWTMKRKGNR